jgi:hypothetical protein
VQNRALIVLFALLAGAFAAVAGDALSHPHGLRRLLVGIVAAVVAAWMVSLALATFRRLRAGR